MRTQVKENRLRTRGRFGVFLRLVTIGVGFILHEGITPWVLVHIFFPVITWIKWLFFDYDKLLSIFNKL